MCHKTKPNNKFDLVMTTEIIKENQAIIFGDVFTL